MKNIWTIGQCFIFLKMENRHTLKSTHVKTRMIQHAIAEEKRIFEKVHFIYSRLFNQSVTFDYESKLIQYIVADELFQVTNKNFGIADKQYYQKKSMIKSLKLSGEKLQKQNW